MNIAVLIKQVVDVELNIRVKNDALVEEGLTYVISNWDEIAIETAIQIIESVGEGTVTLISVGPDRVQDALRRGLAMGADEAVHILDTAIDGSDSYAYAKLFAKILEEQDYDIILGGKQAQDTDAGLTMSMLAEFMDLPQVMNVSKIVSLGKEQCTFHRRGELGNELIDITLPAVLTPNDSLFEPRMPSLRGMMQSKKKPIETKSLSDIGVDPDLVGKSGKKVKVNRLIQPDQRKGGQIFEGEEAETTKQVLALLAKNEVGKENLFT